MSTKFYAVDRRGGKTFFQRTTFKDALKHLLFFAVVSNVFCSSFMTDSTLHSQLLSYSQYNIVKRSSRCTNLMRRSVGKTGVYFLEKSLVCESQNAR